MPAPAAITPSTSGTGKFRTAAALVGYAQLQCRLPGAEK